MVVGATRCNEGKGWNVPALKLSGRGVQRNRGQAEQFLSVLPAGLRPAHQVYPQRASHRSEDLLQHLKSWAKSVKRDVVALWLAARDPRTPWYAKLLAVAVAGYALSPIDLIPDFIPVLGYLDELIVLPLGILATVALIPRALMDELRIKAEKISERPRSRWAIAVIALLWIAAAAIAGWLLHGFVQDQISLDRPR